MSDQPVAETSTLQHTTLTRERERERDIHANGMIRNRNSSKRAAADPRLRPRDCWDRQIFVIQ
jgi:hypothetical protein